MKNTHIQCIRKMLPTKFPGTLMSIACGWVMLNAVFAETNLLSDYHYAEIAYEHQQYELALRELAPLVEAGQAEAQYLLARMQQNGQGMAANIPEAVKTYHLSAQQGYMPAQVSIGTVL